MSGSLTDEGPLETLLLARSRMDGEVTTGLGDLDSRVSWMRRGVMKPDTWLRRVPERRSWGSRDPLP